MAKNVVIIGGVAGGMAAATRLRRLDEKVKITVIEKGPYISFANCGMPYYIGDVIKDRSRLFVKTPQEISELFNIDVRIQTEALSIQRDSKKVSVKDLTNNNEYEVEYDQLIIATGAAPFVPDIPGIKNDRTFKLRNIEDMDNIYTFIEQKKPQKAVVIGGGFIGLELAENLRHRNMDVSIVELDKQVMAPVDPEISSYINDAMEMNSVKLFLKNSVEKVEPQENSLKITLKDETVLQADLLIVSIGVKPDTKLAINAGLETGPKNSIIVDEKMQTSDTNIFAVGDAILVKDFVSNSDVLIPLAGPANRQGRIVAENMFGLNKVYKNTQGTSICKICDLTVASTGLNEKVLKHSNINYLKTYIHSFSHAGYYPDSFPLVMKLLFTPDEGKILGAQISGYKGVDKRIDVLATALRSGLTVYDLEYLELAYAPPYNMAKDPVNVIGNVAANMLNGLVEVINPEDIDTLNPETHTILDVSTNDEHQNGHIEGSICIPVEELRNHLEKLDKEKTIITYCQMGLRGYIAYRILVQNGFKVKNISGGYKLYKALKNMESKDYSKAESNNQEVSQTENINKDTEAKISVELDACGLQCPGPIMRLKDTISKIQPGEVIQITATDPGFMADVKAWCNRTGNELMQVDRVDGKIEAKIRKQDPEKVLQTQTASGVPAKKDKTLILFSNDLDKALAAFIIANGAASMGDKVTIFFTFWGLNVLRKDAHIPTQKGFLDRMFGMMMPRGATKLALSKMHMMGMGTTMMKYVMKNKNVLSLPDLMKLAQENGVRLAACTMSMDVMGIKKEELIEGVEEVGVAGYLDNANDSNVNLFI